GSGRRTPPLPRPHGGHSAPRRAVHGISRGEEPAAADRTVVLVARGSVGGRTATLARTKVRAQLAHPRRGEANFGGDARPGHARPEELPSPFAARGQIG